MSRYLAYVSALIVALMPAVARAQPAVIPLDGTTVHKHAAGTNLDLYRFVAVAGTKATIVVNVTGAAMATLYTPEGEQMLHAEGTDKVSLEAFLPASSAYVLSVARASKAKPYSLKLNLEQPTLAQAYLSQGVGYGGANHASSCWMEPGRVRKITANDYDVVGTIDATDHVSYVLTFRNGTGGTYQTKLARKGDGVIVMNTLAGGTTDESVATFDWLADVSYAWERYLCR